eukprot:1901025-Ditylum_brightwellii.AAC.1
MSSPLRKKQRSSLLNSPKEKNVEDKYSWEQRFDQLCSFKAQKGHFSISRNDAKNKSLGLWVRHQRVFYKKNALSSDRVEQLNSIGFIWDPLEYGWNEHFNQLCAFKAQKGHFNVPQNKSLGKWVNQQRVFYKKNVLNSGHAEQLNSIGFIWDPLGHAWNEHFNQLCAFKAQKGH